MVPIGVQVSDGFMYGAHVRANDIRQHYIRFGGSGPSLIVIPGIASPAAMWAFVAERLCQHFDTYVLDVRGRGLSESGPHLDYGLDACASDVVCFTAALGLVNYTIVGHSMGARIALRIARSKPASLARIVLIDPPVSGPGRRPYPSSLPSLLELLHSAKRGEAIELLRNLGPQPWPEKQLLKRAEWLHTCDERAIVASHRGFHEDDIHSDFRHVEVPAKLIVAGKGGVILPEDEREIQELLPSISISRVPNAGHQIQIDDFDGLFEVLGAALNVEFP